MCGITGIFKYGNLELTYELVERMTSVISHRGPDDCGVFIDSKNRAALGHRRLSIIDLSEGGHQPMTTKDGRYVITYNGEIYNYKEVQDELRRSGFTFNSDSDTEIILYSYVKWGKDCLSKFNGMFAFCIYDSIENKIFAARDRIGIKPFYYFNNSDFFIFSSEIKSLLASGLIDAEPDLFALHTPTRFQISPYTGFKNIYKLPPGHFIFIENNKLLIEKYWDISPEEEALNEQEAVNELDSLLNDSVRLQLTADVPVGIFLSGGLDSSIIAALMKRYYSENINAFTIKFSSEDQKYEKMVDDSYYAKKVAADFGFSYHEFEIKPDVGDLLPKMVWHLEEPVADPAAINTYLMSSSARDKNIKVLLNGMGGDEIFGGYRKHLACLKAEVYQSVLPRYFRSFLESSIDKLPVASSGSGFKTLRWIKRFLSFASLNEHERFMASDLSLNEKQYSEYFINGVDFTGTHYYKSYHENFSDQSLSYLTRMCLSDTRIMLPEHNLTYTDKASMAAGVECRPPLTDHRIVDFMFRLKPDLRIKNNVQKYLLKKVSEKYLPKEIIYRPKAPFGSPLRSWIRGQLREMVDDLLSEEALKKRQLYNPGYVSKLIKNDRDGAEDNAHIIWTLLTNEIWFRKFFDNSEYSINASGNTVSENR